MPTPEELKEKAKAEEKARADQAIKQAYCDAARKFITVPVGDDREKKVARRALATATTTLRNRFSGAADDIMLALSQAAYRGERP